MHRPSNVFPDMVDSMQKDRIIANRSYQREKLSIDAPGAPPIPIMVPTNAVFLGWSGGAAHAMLWQFLLSVV
jgi:hypothetical protein